MPWARLNAEKSAVRVFDSHPVNRRGSVPRIWMYLPSPSSRSSDTLGSRPTASAIFVLGRLFGDASRRRKRLTVTVGEPNLHFLALFGKDYIVGDPPFRLLF